jgi:hypothetical protein
MCGVCKGKPPWCLENISIFYNEPRLSVSACVCPSVCQGRNFFCRFFPFFLGRVVLQTRQAPTPKYLVSFTTYGFTHSVCLSFFHEKRAPRFRLREGRERKNSPQGLVCRRRKHTIVDPKLFMLSPWNFAQLRFQPAMSSSPDFMFLLRCKQ